MRAAYEAVRLLAFLGVGLILGALALLSID